jgi:hypothetical protein
MRDLIWTSARRGTQTLQAKKERIGLRVGAYDLHVHFVHAWLYPQKLVAGVFCKAKNCQLK